ncbi:MAG: hypothetical protein Q9160_002326 [Pyrenula sp. 1 TL-2023]
MRLLTLTALIFSLLVAAQDIPQSPQIEATLLPATSARPEIDIDASLRAEGWVLASTVTSQAPAATPTPTNRLDLREVVGAAAQALPTVATQQSPVTQVQVNGVLQVYTQTFAKVLDQLPAPSKGTIGLGTIQGTVGGVEKRNTQETATLKAAEKRDANNAGIVRPGTGSVLALLVAIAAAIA